MLEALLGPEAKKRLAFQKMSNDDIWQHYYTEELATRLRNTKDIKDHQNLLNKFKDFLGGYPPSEALAKSFLAQYTNRKARTLARYSKMIRGLFKFMGQPFEFKVKIPKSLPDYTSDLDIEKLFKAIENKRGRLGQECVVRDILLLETALKTGLRRGELANLKVKDIHPDFLVVRQGKNKKDRIVPLSAVSSLRIQNFIKDKTKKSEDSIFDLTGPSITMKIKQFARKAGIEDFHAHSTRHKFATDLLEKGVNVRVVQELLGHENLNTTQVYLSVSDTALSNAVKTLDKKPVKKERSKADHKKLHVLEEEIEKADGNTIITVPPDTVEKVPYPPVKGNFSS